MIVAIALGLAAPQAVAPTDCPTPAASDLEHQQHGKGLWIGGVAFNGDDVASAIVKRDQNTYEPTVVVRFTPSGHGKFRTAQRCRLNRAIEIWLDDELVSSPYLMTPIEGPEAVITGNFTAASAASFAARISPAKP